jgi:hypothetical protein
MFVGIIATNIAHPAYVGTPPRPHRTARAVDSLFNAQFVTKHATA